MTLLFLPILLFLFLNCSLLHNDDFNGSWKIIFGCVGEKIVCDSSKKTIKYYISDVRLFNSNTYNWVDNKLVIENLLWLSDGKYDVGFYQMKYWFQRLQ